MNEEVIKQCARGGTAEHQRDLGWDALASGTERGASDETPSVQSSLRAIRLYHARHVAPLEQENAELRALVKELTEQAKADGERIGRLEANVAPLVEAAREAVRSMDKEGDFIASSFLKDALAAFDAGAAPQPSPDVARLVEAAQELYAAQRALDENPANDTTAAWERKVEAVESARSNLAAALAPFQQEGSQ